MFKRRCKITFIRNGSTINTDEERFSDKQDFPPLTELGKIEAENIAKWVQRRSPKVDKIYSSSDLRTIQTANYIAKEYQKDFEIIDNLYNKKCGLWDGLTFRQIEKKYPETLKEYHQNRGSYCPEGGENTEQLISRVNEAIGEIIAKNQGKRIIIVTHGAVIKAAIASAVGVPANQANQIHIPCGSATQISYYEDWASLIYSGHVPL